MTSMDRPLFNRDVDWDRWPVSDYVDELYRRTLPSADAVIVPRSAFFRRFPAGPFGGGVERGAGPSLYPLMLLAGVSRELVVVEPSAASRAYLDRQLGDGPDPHWQVF